MSSHFRAPLVIAIALAGFAYADEPGSALTAANDWLESMRATCAQQYSAEQCQDDDFLDEHFHTRDLQTAHRASIRRNEMEQRALRELLLQRSCRNPVASCENSSAPNCLAQLQQMCGALQQQAAACAEQALQYCATAAPTNDCVVQQQARCPSAKKQTIDKLLAKYPKLTAQQQAHVRSVAQQMDANQSGTWLGDLLRWIGF